MQTHFPLGKLQFSVRSNADEPMKYVEKHTVPSFHEQLRPRRGYDGIRDCRLASKEKAGNALPRIDPGGSLGKGGAGESGPGRLGSRGERLRSNPSIPAATTKQLGKRKSVRPTPGLELCSSAPDSRQRTEHLRHNADGLALPVNPLEKSVRILIRLILELLRIPARTLRSSIRGRLA